LVSWRRLIMETNELLARYAIHNTNWCVLGCQHVFKDVLEGALAVNANIVNTQIPMTNFYEVLAIDLKFVMDLYIALRTLGEYPPPEVADFLIEILDYEVADMKPFQILLLKQVLSSMVFDVFRLLSKKNV
jgi:hypothetical protein